MGLGEWAGRTSGLALAAHPVYIECMTTPRKLSSEDHEFFTQLARVIFVNPFSEERARVDAGIAGKPEIARLPEEQRVICVHAAIHATIHAPIYATILRKYYLTKLLLYAIIMM